MDFDKKTYKAVKNAVKNGVIYPKEPGVAEFSYKGTTYIVTRYQVADNICMTGVRLRGVKYSNLKEFVSHMKHTFGPAVCFTVVQIQNWAAKETGAEPKEVKYTGVKSFNLARLVHQRRKSR